MPDEKDFKTRLKIAKSELDKKTFKDNGEKKGLFMGNAFKLGTELVSAVAVGTIIGYILDMTFGTIELGKINCQGSRFSTSNHVRSEKYFVRNREIAILNPVIHVN